MPDQHVFAPWRPHPWHGLTPGSDPPRLVHGYIEITPFDTVKYEVDKATGYLRVDRPQRSSAQPPALYGFIPRTYCDAAVAALSPHATGADGDPLDICVFSERPVSRPEVLLDVMVLGGLRAVDSGVADDKIIGVLYNDLIWGDAQDIGDIPRRLVERLIHYFSTYKMIPGQESKMVIEEVYNAEHARRVVSAAIDDYTATFGQADGQA